MKKSFNGLISLAVLFVLIGPTMPGQAQPVLPDENQIVEFLAAHPILLETGAEVLEVRIQRGSLVINFSGDLLPQGTYDDALFSRLQEDLDLEFEVNSLFMTTFLVEGQPVEIWGDALPDFSLLAEPFQIQELPGAGPLAGVRVALSPGHGWYWNDIYHDWRWQRLNFWGIREDTTNAEIMRYVKAALENQGATVIQLRQLDFSAGNGISTRPAWHEATRHYAIARGMPPWVYDGSNNNYNSDIRARPYMANYLGADLLISLHNNGWNGTLRGTETYWDVNNHPHSEALAIAVHSNVIQTLRANVESDWRSRGVKSSNWSYGEIYFAQMPAILLELAFMDNAQDNHYLQQEWFKILSAQAIVRGICQFRGVDCGSITTTLPVTSEVPTLSPAYGNGMCDSGWYRYTNVRDEHAYLALNTDDENAASKLAEWNPVLPASGQYRLEAFIPGHGAINWQCPNKTINSDTTRAVYNIQHANGTSQKVINQAAHSNQWVSLGMFHFDNPHQARVTLSNLTSDANQTATVSASAMRFTLVGNAENPFYNTGWVSPGWARQEANAPIEHLQHFLAYHNTCLAGTVMDADDEVIDFPLLIHQAAVQHQVNPKILLAIMETEHQALSQCPDASSLASLMGLTPASTARDQIDAAAAILGDAINRLESNQATANGWRTGVSRLTHDQVMVTPANHAITILFDYAQNAGSAWNGDGNGDPGVHGIYLAYRDFKLNRPLFTGMNPVFLPLINR